MAESVIKKIKGVGTVLFERSKRACRLNITVRPFTGVRVAVPGRVSFREAEKKVYFYLGWIQKHQSRMRSLQRKHADVLRQASDINKDYAQKRLIKRLAKLAESYEFSYKKVFIRNQTTRWGSCSGKNNINLNLKLLLLPADLRDYVILHELVHTRIRSHGRAFWKELDSFVGNSRRKHLRLQEYGLAFL